MNFRQESVIIVDTYLVLLLVLLLRRYLYLNGPSADVNACEQSEIETETPVVADSNS